MMERIIYDTQVNENGIKCNKFCQENFMLEKLNSFFG